MAARLAHLAFIWSQPLYDFHLVWDESDMHQYVAWARHLAAGDWLDRESFRPYFKWQEAVASREVWSSWFGAHVYYQPPLYPYLLAAALALTGSLDSFRVGQLVLGAVTCGLLALLGLRLYGPATGWISGLAAALYAPFIFYDAEILRGTVVMTTQLVLLLALERSRGGAPAMLLVAGAALGLAYLADPAILLFGPLALVWLWLARRAEGERDWIRASALFVAGAAAALTPLMARNLAVGAPPTSLSTRAPLAFVMGNAPDASPAGAVIPDSTGAILSASGYRVGATVSETLRRYHGNHLALLAQQWRKVKSAWGAYEVPDNPSFYYAAEVSPVVGWGVRFLPVAAAGLVGLALTIGGALREPARALMPLYLLSTVLLFLPAHVTSRYRQPMVIPLMIMGAYALALAARHRDVAAAGIVAAGIAVMFLLPWSPPIGYGYHRSAEPVIAARVHARRGQPGLAAAQITEAIERIRTDPAAAHQVPSLLYERGRIQAEAGLHQEAVESFRAALSEDPHYQEAAEALSASMQALRR